MKRIFMSLLATSLISVGLFAQGNNPAFSLSQSNEQQANAQLKSAMIVTNPAKDQYYSFEVTGISGTIFSTYNVTDGTRNSYNNAQQIIVTLIPADKTKGVFQLTFFSPGEAVLKTASYEKNVLNIYYPIALYESIKDRLDQSFATKKKVMIKVTEKTDGYREGVLSF